MPMVEHIKHTEPSPAHVARSWCGLNIEVRPWTSEQDYRERAERDLIAHICKNCIDAITRGTPRHPSGR